MRTLRFQLTFLALVAALCGGGCATRKTPPPAPVAMSAKERTDHNLRVFDRAWELVNKRFFDEKFRGVDWAAMRPRYRPEAAAAPDEDALYAVLNRMLGELKESHNYAMSPQRRFEVFARQQARVGLRFQRVDERWVVTEVSSGSPAETAGVNPGWLVKARDGIAFDQQVGAPLKPGQSVAYEFIDHKDQARQLSMTARVLSTADRTEMRKLEGGVVYLRFDGFDTKSLRWLRSQLKANRSAPCAVVDLRHNHGGLFFSLEFMLGEFFPKNVQLGSFIRRSGTAAEKDTTQLRSARYPGRVVVLVDETTASCAEIFAHAMRYYGRAIIIGRKTAGAVVVSKFYTLPGGGTMQLAVDDFQAIGGKRLEGVGVMPDRVIPRMLANFRSGRDADLEAALAELRSPVAAKTAGF